MIYLPLVFLHGLINKLSIKECLEKGQKCPKITKYLVLDSILISLSLKAPFGLFRFYNSFPIFFCK